MTLTTPTRTRASEDELEDDEDDDGADLKGFTVPNDDVDNAILLQMDMLPQYESPHPSKIPGALFTTSTDVQQSEFIYQAWVVAHTAIKRRLLRAANRQRPHYIRGDLYTGAGRAIWIVSLSAYYPGVLTLSGHIEEAIEPHLLVTALWTTLSALSERVLPFVHQY